MGQVVFNTAKDCEITYLKKMWKDIFKDTDEYIDLYFSYKFKGENTFVVRDNGKIVSTLYVEYNDVFYNGKTVKGAYFCGIATYSEYRGLGYAKKLIEYAKEHIKKVDIIYLIPANESLFDFYKQTGFRVFTTLSKEEVEKDTGIILPDFSEKFDYEKLNFLYENMGNSLYIKRDEKFFSAIYECYKNIMIFDDGYVIYYTEDDTVMLVEYSFSYNKAKEVLKGIINLKNKDKGIIYKKWTNTPFSVCITNLDMESSDKKYLNLMLN